MCCKHHLIQAKGTSALLSPVCSILARVFLSYGTSPYYNRSLYHREGHKPGLRAYPHHNHLQRLLWRLTCEHLGEYHCSSNLPIISFLKVFLSSLFIDIILLYFLKSTRPSLPLKKAPPFSPSLSFLRNERM